MVNLNQQLKRQLSFLERSAQAFDSGYKDEAIRIAVTVRVLCHTTKNQKALLHRLGADTCEMLTTVEPTSGRELFFDGMSLLQTGSAGARAMPALDRGPIAQVIPLPTWWGQTLYVRGDARLARSDLVLTAADRDGGAHVDPRLTPDYESLARGVWSFYEGGSFVKEESDAHLNFLRQIAYEVLNSPGVLEQLANAR